MMTLLIIILLVFRWKLLGAVIGTKYMYLFDALMFTVLAASNFAEPWPTAPWLGYMVAGLCVFWGIVAARKFLALDALVKTQNHE